MATSDRPPPLLVPSVRHTDEPQSGRNSCLWLFHLCRMTSNGGGRSLVAVNRAPAPQPPETLRCRRLVGVISSD